MLKQELPESRENVAKRIEFIKNEVYCQPNWDGH